MNVREIMTIHPTCCLPDDTVDLPAKLMKIENVGAIPVVESEDSRTLVGILTDRDLALIIVGQGLDPKKTRVRDVMPDNTMVTCMEEDDINTALQSMQQHQVRRIPVVDKNQKLIGIISQCDVALRVAQPRKTAEVVTEISKPSSWEESFQEKRRFSGESHPEIDAQVYLGGRKESSR